MNHTPTRDLLQRTGCLRPAHVQDGDFHLNAVVGGMDPFAEPSTVAELGRRLAEALPNPKPDVVLVWAQLQSLVLGFAVGVALDTPVIRLTDDEGLVDGFGPITPNSRAVLVGVSLSDRDVRLGRAFVEAGGARLRTLAQLVGTPASDGDVSLVSLRDLQHPENACPQCADGVPLQVEAEMGLPDASVARP